MALITEDEAAGFVGKALTEVGDLPNDAIPDVIKNVSFAPFKSLHKKDFLDELKKALNNNDYDAPLSEDLFDNWSTAGDCIAYLLQENIVSPLPI